MQSKKEKERLRTRMLAHVEILMMTWREVVQVDMTPLFLNNKTILDDLVKIEKNMKKVYDKIENAGLKEVIPEE